MITTRRGAEVKRKAVASGIVEVYGGGKSFWTISSWKWMSILNRTVQSRGSDWRRKSVLQKPEKSAEMALQRSERGVDKRFPGVSPNNARSGEKTRRRISYESDDEAAEALVKDMELRLNQEDRCFKLEENRYELEKSRLRKRVHDSSLGRNRSAASLIWGEEA